MKIKSSKMNIVKIFYNSIFVAVAAVALLFIISVLPIPGGIRTLVVMSGSMEPAIKTGSIIVIQPARNYKVGDIITFGEITKTSMPTTHRITGGKIVNGKQVFITKGDANEEEDVKQAPLDEVKGKMLFSIPFLGYGVNFVKTPIGFILLFALPLAYLAILEIRNIFLEIKNSKTKIEASSKDEKNG